MKHILVPTDFSENAKKALDFAVNMAQKSNAKLSVLNSYYQPSANVEVMKSSLMEIMANDSKDGLQETEKYIKTIAPNLEVVYISLRDTLHLAINEVAKNDEVDFLVMGTKGATGLKEVLIGSNAANILDKINIPCLLIPDAYVPSKFEKVGIAYDLQPISNFNNIRTLNSIVNLVQAKTVIGSVNSHKQLSSAQEEYINILKTEVKAADSVFLNIDSTVEGIHAFEIQQKIDMLVMFKRKVGFFENLFHKSITKKIAIHTHIPLLVLHD